MPPRVVDQLPITNRLRNRVPMFFGLSFEFRDVSLTC
jgi:hypothetical protein